MAEEGANLVKLDDFGGEIDEHWQEAEGSSVLDKNGDEVGTVEELYVWEDASTVHLIKVTSDDGSFLIPVHTVTNVGEEGVKLETARDKVTASPELIGVEGYNYLLSSTDVFPYFRSEFGVGRAIFVSELLIVDTTSAPTPASACRRRDRRPRRACASCARPGCRDRRRAAP